MTPRERLLTVLRGEIPDCVPVAPDFSNMIPARLTGKPFWDLYLYNDPPIWEAYIDCARRFDIDSLMDGYFPLTFPEERTGGSPERERFIVEKTPERIVTRSSHVEDGKRVWAPTVEVFPVAEPAKWGIPAAAMHMPPEPERLEAAERRFELILKMEAETDVRPDFLCVGGSGTLVFQTEEMFRRVAFPAVKRVIELASAAGLPTHVHSCGPESKLVRIIDSATWLRPGSAHWN
jgi:hypothetical protein